MGKLPPVELVHLYLFLFSTRCIDNGEILVVLNFHVAPHVAQTNCDLIRKYCHFGRAFCSVLLIHFSLSATSMSVFSQNAIMNDQQEVVPASLKGATNICPHCNAQHFWLHWHQLQHHHSIGLHPGAKTS